MTDKTKTVDKPQSSDKKQVPIVGWVDRCQKLGCGFRSGDGRCLFRKGVSMDTGGCCMSYRLYGSHPPVKRVKAKYVHWKDNIRDNHFKKVLTK